MDFLLLCHIMAGVFLTALLAAAPPAARRLKALWLLGIFALLQSAVAGTMLFDLIVLPPRDFIWKDLGHDQFAQLLLAYAPPAAFGVDVEASFRVDRGDHRG